jgi:regulator of protease activity HflC (stomatin/prohibitin superfamily)
MNEALVVTFCVIAVMTAMMLLFVASSIRIIPESARMAIFRLGRFEGIRGPGLMLLIPFIDRGIQLDLREKTEKITENLATQDDARINIQMKFGYRISNPERSILNGPDLSSSARMAAINCLKPVVGNMAYGDVSHDRAKIEAEFKNRFAETMNLWGYEVTSVEITEILRG